ncbi:MAG: sigma-54-dependent transcriptional regulator [Polyangiales bacterium]
MNRALVLVVDDEATFRFAMHKALSRLDYNVEEAGSGEEALVRLRKKPAPDVVLLDIQMQGIDGLEVLRRRGHLASQFIVLTGHGSVGAAVEAMRLGALSFLEKPIDAEVLAPLLRQATHESHRKRDGQDPGDGQGPALVGASHGMAEVKEFLARVAPTDETVAIFGETGTGKEVVARYLHGLSPRRGRPFIAFNAACVPHELFESELFGHKKGAFTGANTDRLGLFRDAEDGTLFIDEVGELPLDSQAKMLRALEARAIRPVGDSRELPVQARIVVATNRDLWQLVQRGRFREDLYFRLQVFPVVLPPLRDRLDDIPALAHTLLARLGDRSLHLASDAVSALQHYHWPGNVRELLNVLRRAALFAHDGQIDAELVQRMVAASVFGQPEPSTVRTSSSKPPPQAHLPQAISSLAEVERAHITHVLQDMQGNITRAAVALGIDRRTLQRKLKAYGIDSAADSS